MPYVIHSHPAIPGPPDREQVGTARLREERTDMDNQTREGTIGNTSPGSMELRGTVRNKKGQVGPAGPGRGLKEQ